MKNGILYFEEEKQKIEISFATHGAKCTKTSMSIALTNIHPIILRDRCAHLCYDDHHERSVCECFSNMESVFQHARAYVSQCGTEQADPREL